MFFKIIFNRLPFASYRDNHLGSICNVIVSQAIEGVQYPPRGILRGFGSLLAKQLTNMLFGDGCQYIYVYPP
jgi:hypothetical protein